MTETIKIDGKRALELLGRAVAEKGEDYVDPGSRSKGILGAIDGCQYFVTDRVTGETCPSCIVGHVISYVSPGTLDGAENVRGIRDLFLAIEVEDSDGQTFTYEVELWNGDVIVLDEDAYSGLVAAQSSQDNGNDWGTALVEAKRVAGVL